MGRFYLSLTTDGVLDLIDQLGATSAGFEVQRTILVALKQFTKTGVSPRIRELFPREMMDAAEDLTGATDWLAADSPLWTRAFASEVLPHYYQSHFYRDLEQIRNLQIAEYTEEKQGHRDKAMRRGGKAPYRRQSATPAPIIMIPTSRAVASN